MTASNPPNIVGLLARIVLQKHQQQQPTGYPAMTPPTAKRAKLETQQQQETNRDKAAAIAISPSVPLTPEIAERIRVSRQAALQRLNGSSPFGPSQVLSSLVPTSPSPATFSPVSLVSTPTTAPRAPPHQQQQQQETNRDEAAAIAISRAIGQLPQVVISQQEWENSPPLRSSSRVQNVAVAKQPSKTLPVPTPTRLSRSQVTSDKDGQANVVVPKKAAPMPPSGSSPPFQPGILVAKQTIWFRLPCLPPEHLRPQTRAIPNPCPKMRPSQNLLGLPVAKPTRLLVQTFISVVRLFNISQRLLPL